MKNDVIISTSPVTALCSGANGRYILSGHNDGTITVWEKGKLVFTVTNMEFPIRFLMEHSFEKKNVWHSLIKWPTFSELSYLHISSCARGTGYKRMLNYTLQKLEFHNDFHLVSALVAGSADKASVDDINSLPWMPAFCSDFLRDTFCVSFDQKDRILVGALFVKEQKNFITKIKLGQNITKVVGIIAEKSEHQIFKEHAQKHQLKIIYGTQEGYLSLQQLEPIEKENSNNVAISLGSDSPITALIRAGENCIVAGNEEGMLYLLSISHLLPKNPHYKKEICQNKEMFLAAFNTKSIDKDLKFSCAIADLLYLPHKNDIVAVGADGTVKIFSLNHHSFTLKTSYFYPDLNIIKLIDNTIVIGKKDGCISIDPFNSEPLLRQARSKDIFFKFQKGVTCSFHTFKESSSPKNITLSHLEKRLCSMINGMDALNGNAIIEKKEGGILIHFPDDNTKSVAYCKTFHSILESLSYKSTSTAGQTLCIKDTKEFEKIVTELCAYPKNLIDILNGKPLEIVDYYFSHKNNPSF